MTSEQAYKEYADYVLSLQMKYHRRNVFAFAIKAERQKVRELVKQYYDILEAEKAAESPENRINNN